MLKVNSKAIVNTPKPQNPPKKGDFEVDDNVSLLSISLAEKERFELSNRFTGYTISSRAPSTKLGDFSMPQALPVNKGYFTTG